MIRYPPSPLPSLRPLTAYGVDYRGGPIDLRGGPTTGAEAQRAGLEQPVYFWDPVIAPSGAQFYSGAAFPAWRGSLFVGALRGMWLVRLVIEDDRVIGEEHLLADHNTTRARGARRGAVRRHRRRRAVEDCAAGPTSTADW